MRETGNGNGRVGVQGEWQTFGGENSQKSQNMLLGTSLWLGNKWSLCED